MATILGYEWFESINEELLKNDEYFLEQCKQAKENIDEFRNDSNSDIITLHDKWWNTIKMWDTQINDFI